MKRSFIREILDVTSNGMISFAGGLPDASLFPVEALCSVAQTVMREASVFQYAASQGMESLREKIAERYTRSGFSTHPDEILITTGSQQAINLAAKAFLDNGISVELPAYLGALGAFNLSGIDIDGIALNDGNIDMKQLKQSVDKTKAAYLIPDFQNPTGNCYSEDIRMSVAETLLAGGALLIEDAAYSELSFGKRHRPVSCFMPEQSLHLGSFSKVLAPGLRVGWIRADKTRIRRLMIIKEVLDLHTATLNQSLIDGYWERYGLKGHIDSIRSIYSEKMNNMADILDGELPDFKFERPQGGMFIYGKLPGVDTMALVRRCIPSGVVFVPGSEFYPGAAPSDEIRLNFSHTASEQMHKGVRLIAAEVSKR